MGGRRGRDGCTLHLQTRLRARCRLASAPALRPQHLAIRCLPPTPRLHPALQLVKGSTAPVATATAVKRAGFFANSTALLDIYDSELRHMKRIRFSTGSGSHRFRVCGTSGEAGGRRAAHGGRRSAACCAGGCDGGPVPAACLLHTCKAWRRHQCRPVAGCFRLLPLLLARGLRPACSRCRAAAGPHPHLHRPGAGHVPRLAPAGALPAAVQGRP